jgi:flavin reductase (DIM6/NTAB) family NADH-FMN oxidoreductase RutF
MAGLVGRESCLSRPGVRANHVNHGPTVLVTSAAGSCRNVMAAAWSMPVEFTPARIAVVIDKKTFTRELVAASGAFGICLPGTALVDLTYAVGSKTGRKVDKFALHGIVATPGAVLGVPLIESGCAAWLECIALAHSLRSALCQTIIGQALLCRAAAGAVEHRVGDIDTERAALQGRASRPWRHLSLAR